MHHRVKSHNMCGALPAVPAEKMRCSRPGSPALLWCRANCNPVLAGVTPHTANKHVCAVKEEMTREGGEQSTWYGITCWKVWAQGFGSGWAGVLAFTCCCCLSNASVCSPVIGMPASDV